MKDYTSQLEDAWLGIDVDESTLFNPMDFLMQDSDNEKLVERIAWLMMRPEYFSFACKPKHDNMLTFGRWVKN
jgi:hypothetical protein